MKAWPVGFAVLAVAIGLGSWWHYRVPRPTVLTFRIGQPFEDVVKNSTFPVMQHSPEGKKRLYERMFEPGYSQSAELRVPKKYAMTFRLKCAEGCWTREPPYKFLVDLGVGDDVHEWWDKEDPKNRPPIRPSMP